MSNFEQNSAHLRKAFLAVLSPHVPGLAADNISVEEVRPKMTPEQKMMNRLEDLDAMTFTGRAIEEGAVTFISFEGVELNHETMRVLKESVDDVTGYWNAYSSRSLQFQGSSETFVNALNVEALAGALQSRL